jgi:SAM-dependent methyltransferase
MSIRLRTVVTGALSYVPGAMPLYRRFAFRPNPAPAALSYGIWLKHLALSQACRAQAVPRIVAELGPGLSLGAGLAALICGAQRYIALDAVRFAPMAQVLPIFERLVELFMRRVRPENANGFPSYESLLDGAGFPAQVLPEAHMKIMLAPERIAKLRQDVQTFVDSGGQPSAHITYLAPWQLTQVPQRGEIDFLFSHTVLQHVLSPAVVWQDIGELLCPGGVCSHQISFDSQGTSAIWNGHWAYPEALWRIALGRKAFLINREPLSRHLSAAQRSGLTPVAAMRLQDDTGIRRAALAGKWRDLDDHDLTTRGALLVARKP